jgi:hypothetical protein
MSEWVSIKWRDLVDVACKAAWDAIRALERRVRTGYLKPGPRDN